MAKKIEIVGAKPKKVEIVDQPKRRIDPMELAAALGANPADRQAMGNLDLISLAELGTQLLDRLRSSGGRPALADATEICRVPLSAEDVKTLEGMVAQVEASSRAKPSVGQLVSVIVRAHLQSLQAVSSSAREAPGKQTEPDQSSTIAALQQLVEEQIRPLREQVRRLEAELQAVAGGRG